MIRSKVESTPGNALKRTFLLPCSFTIFQKRRARSLKTRSPLYEDAGGGAVFCIAALTSGMSAILLFSPSSRRMFCL